MRRRLIASAVMVLACNSHAPQMHRAVPDICTNGRPPISPYPSDASAINMQSQCASDEECFPNAGQNGRCTPLPDASCDGVKPCGFCTYDLCQGDESCATVCNCRGGLIHDSTSPNVCLPSGNCVLDRDCASGFCSPSLDYGCSKSGWVGYFCHTSADECTNDSDCDGVEKCSFNWSALRWSCSLDVCP